MQQQGTTTLRDALRNVAGISLAAGEGGAQGDNLTIRGFTARNDLFIDGMRDFGSYYRDPFNTQEVEVLQGPSSVTFGRGSTGGVVNQASKTPGLNQFLSADLQFGTDTTRRAAIDWSAPLPQLGKGTAFRLNAMGNIGNVAGRNIAENRRTGIAPSLAFGLGSATRTTLSYLHQNEDNVPDYGLPWLFNQPAPVNRNNYYGLPGNFLRTYADIGTAKVEHDVNSHLTLRNQVRYANYSRAVLVTEPRLSGITLGTPLSSVTVTRGQISARSTETFLDEQLDAVAHFKTLGIRHTLVTGVEGTRETSDPTRATYPAPSTSLLNPVYSGGLGIPTITSVVNDAAVGFGAYVLDTASIGRHIEASGGVRYDRFDNSYRQTVGSVANFSRLDQKPTWRAALVYKPTANGSIYFDAGTSFNPSAESLSLTAGSANIPPETNKTTEFGTKWEFNGGRPASQQFLVQDSERKRARKRPYKLVAGRARRNSKSEWRPDERQGAHHEPLGASVELRVPGQSSCRFAILPDRGWLCARKRSAEHVQFLEHSPSAPAFRRGHWSKLCLEPECQFDRAARPHNRVGQSCTLLLGF